MQAPTERLKKLYELALRGVDGEKENAKTMLDKLLKKYAVSIEELNDEIVQEYELAFHGKIQEKLLKQTVYKVTGDTCNTYNLSYVASGRPCKTRLCVYCTEAQKIEIEFLFDFYCRIWETECDMLLFAFIQKHEIFGKLKDGEKGTTLTKEERLKLAALMDGLSDETPLLQIESKQ